MSSVRIRGQQAIKRSLYGRPFCSTPSLQSAFGTPFPRVRSTQSLPPFGGFPQFFDLIVASLRYAFFKVKKLLHPLCLGALSLRHRQRIYSDLLRFASPFLRLLPRSTLAVATQSPLRSVCSRPCGWLHYFARAPLHEENPALLRFASRCRIFLIPFCF